MARDRREGGRTALGVPKLGYSVYFDEPQNARGCACVDYDTKSTAAPLINELSFQPVRYPGRHGNPIRLLLLASGLGFEDEYV